MQSWNLLELETPNGSRSPIVLHSTEDARAVLIGLEPGQELGDHQVHENAYMVVIAGQVQVQSGDETVEAGPSTLVRFEATERHAIASRDGARILLVLAPWPGPGHYRGSGSSD
ncbi:MAG TPA: cupin domain-containing protein [Gaiellaceae bacterium]|nr:cupin domain-containing protein [Gaiellaceae bacterium]